MKKIYIQPQTMVFAINIKDYILTTSNVSVSNEVYEDDSMTDLSRRKGLWDDDDEDGWL